MGRFEGKVALVTGAARGQGRRHAVRLSQEGAAVIAVDLCAQIGSVAYPMSTPEDLVETVRLVHEAGGTVLACQVDVRDRAALTQAVDASVAEFGRLDVVAANAGIAGTEVSTSVLTEQAWDDMLGTNLTGVWNTTSAAVPHLVAGGRGGSIVLTSSVAGLKAYPGIGHYVAAKHGVQGLMRSLALELAEHRIRVNTINPTNVDTPMIQNEHLWRRFCPDIAEPTRQDYAENAKRLNVMPEPWADVDDISNALLFLASDESRCITGVALPVDLGSLLR